MNKGFADLILIEIFILATGAIAILPIIYQVFAIMYIIHICL